MTGGVDGDAGRAIEEHIAVDVLDEGTGGIGNDEWITAGIGGRNDARVAGDQCPGIRTRKGRDDLRPYLLFQRVPPG